MKGIFETLISMFVRDPEPTELFEDNDKDKDVGLRNDDGRQEWPRDSLGNPAAPETDKLG